MARKLRGSGGNGDNGNVHVPKEYRGMKPYQGKQELPKATVSLRESRYNPAHKIKQATKPGEPRYLIRQKFTNSHRGTVLVLCRLEAGGHGCQQSKVRCFYPEKQPIRLSDTGNVRRAVSKDIKDLLALEKLGIPLVRETYGGRKEVLDHNFMERWA